MLNKRGQIAAMLIIGLAILSVLYILLIPLSEKCKILPSMPECKEMAFQKEVLFEAKPGMLESSLESASYSLNPVSEVNISDGAAQ